MKAIQILQPGDLHIVEIEKPALDETNNVLIRMTAAGICGSDIAIYRGTNAAATYPRIIGHENVGVVEQVLPGVTRVKPGDRVIVDQVTACGKCYACRQGRSNVCGSLLVRGVHIDGGYREFMAVSEDNCYLLPENISDVDAVLIEPATIAAQCCSRAQITREDTVLLIGAGSLGISILHELRSWHPKMVIAADIVDERLKHAKELGADYCVNSALEKLSERCRELTDGYGSTVTIDAACVKGSLLLALEATGNAGRVITMGFSSAPEEINQFLITSKELDVRGSRLQNRKFQQIVDKVGSGDLVLKGGVSHTFDILDAEKAFRLAASGDPSVRKVAFTFQRLIRE